MTKPLKTVKEKSHSVCNVRMYSFVIASNYSHSIINHALCAVLHALDWKYCSLLTNNYTIGKITVAGGEKGNRGERRQEKTMEEKTCEL